MGLTSAWCRALLTHKDSRTTQRYAHLSPGALRDAAQRSGGLLTPGAKPDNVIKMESKPVSGDRGAPDKAVILAAFPGIHPGPRQEANMGTIELKPETLEAIRLFNQYCYPKSHFWKNQASKQAALDMLGSGIFGDNVLKGHEKHKTTYPVILGNLITELVNLSSCVCLSFPYLLSTRGDRWYI